MAPEIEVIRAEATLGMAADRLDLPGRWIVTRDGAIAMLREIVKLEPIRGTDLIQIRVRHTNAEDARDVAMEVARAYRELERDGYIAGKRGRGTFPTPDLKLPAQKKKAVLREIYERALSEGARHRIGADEIVRFFQKAKRCPN